MCLQTWNNKNDSVGLYTHNELYATSVWRRWNPYWSVKYLFHSIARKSVYNFDVMCFNWIFGWYSVASPLNETTTKIRDCSFLFKKIFKFSRVWNFPYGIYWKQKHAQRFEACQILTTLYPSLPFVSVQESTSARGRCQNGISMSVSVRHLQQVVFFANMPWKIWKTNEHKPVNIYYFFPSCL